MKLKTLLGTTLFVPLTATLSFADILQDGDSSYNGGADITSGSSGNYVNSS